MTIALPGDLPAIQDRLREQLAGVDLRFVALSSPKDFFEGRAPQVDAFAMLAEAGAAWSILYPAYSVVVPQPGAIAVPVGVGMRRGEAELAGVVNDWLVIQRSAGVLSQVRDYWVLGHGAQKSATPLVDPPRRAGLGPPCGQAGPMILEHGGARAMTRIQDLTPASAAVAVAGRRDGHRAPCWRRHRRRPPTARRRSTSAGSSR